jgi:hypothetical protein
MIISVTTPCFKASRLIERKSLTRHRECVTPYLLYNLRKTQTIVAVSSLLMRVLSINVYFPKCKSRNQKEMQCNLIFFKMFFL